MNKVFLPRLKGRIVASITKLFLMKVLTSFVEVNLPRILIELTVNICVSKEHVLGYGFLVSKVFGHSRVNPQLEKFFVQETNF